MKYGRRPRTFNPGVPHWSALKMGAAPIDVPTVCSYTKGLPTDLGVMLNDRLGDCAEAGYCHADQVWSVAAGKPILTAPDSAVEALYSTQGYVPGNPSTDQGTVLQSLLTYLVQTAKPAGGLPKLAAFVEIDPTNEDDLNRATYESGLLYIGMTVPAYAQGALDTLGATLDVVPGGDKTVIGGHCVISAGYRPGYREFISYGCAGYSMTTAYWHQNVDECYALVSPEFCEANGLTPLGQTVAFWDGQMIAIKGVA
jgi:hypothetical protein